MALSNGTVKIGEKTYNSIEDYVNNTCSHESFDVETDEQCPDCGIKKITFTIKLYNWPATETFYAYEGMTWEMWINSDFNPGDIEMSSWDGCIVSTGDEGGALVDNNDEQIYGEDYIVENNHYVG